MKLFRVPSSSRPRTAGAVDVDAVEGDVLLIGSQLGSLAPHSVPP